MSGQLETLNISEESTASNSQTNSTSSVKRKCYELFFSCFRSSRKREPEEDTTNPGSNDYDYIIEKLVIKRVPFIFPGIHTNTSDNFITGIQRPLMKMNALKTRSLLYSSKGFNRNTLPVDKVDSNTIIPDDRNDTARIIEPTNTSTSLRLDLSECERPCPLNIPTNTSTLSKIPAINSGDRKRKMIELEPHIPEIVLTHKEFGAAKPPITRSKTKQKIYYSRQDNKEWLVRHDQGMFYGLRNVTEFTDTNKLNTENSDQKFNTLDTKLRWKITVKHFRPK